MREIGIKQLKVSAKPGKLPVIYFQVEESEALDEFLKLEDMNLNGFVLNVTNMQEKSPCANSYLWHLCDRIAMATRATKHDVYKQAIREVGVWHDEWLDNSEAMSICKGWEANGVGWFVEPVMCDAERMLVRFYKGSSVYTNRQLCRIVSYVVDEAENLGLQSLSVEEIMALETSQER